MSERYVFSSSVFSSSAEQELHKFVFQHVASVREQEDQYVEWLLTQALMYTPINNWLSIIVVRQDGCYPAVACKISL